MPDEFLSEAPPEALMELKIPGPLIPVLDPSSAADWEIVEGPALASLNLFEGTWCRIGAYWPPRGGYCTAEPTFIEIGRSHLETLPSILLLMGGWNAREVELGLSGCIPKNISSSLDLLCRSPPAPFRSNCIRTQLTMLENTNPLMGLFGLFKHGKVKAYYNSHLHQMRVLDGIMIQVKNPISGWSHKCRIRITSLTSCYPVTHLRPRIITPCTI